MIIPDITKPFFPAVVRGAEDQAFSNGYRMFLCNTDNNHSKEVAHLNELRTYLPAGLVVIPSTFSDLTVQAKSYRDVATGVVQVVMRVGGSDRRRSTSALAILELSENRQRVNRTQVSEKPVLSPSGLDL